MAADSQFDYFIATVGFRVTVILVVGTEHNAGVGFAILVAGSGVARLRRERFAGLTQVVGMRYVVILSRDLVTGYLPGFETTTARLRAL